MFACCFVVFACCVVVGPCCSVVCCCCGDVVAVVWFRTSVLQCGFCKFVLCGVILVVFVAVVV